MSQGSAGGAVRLKPAVDELREAKEVSSDRKFMLCVRRERG